jgi:hypothetical protein
VTGTKSEVKTEVTSPASLDASQGQWKKYSNSDAVSSRIEVFLEICRGQKRKNLATDSHGKHWPGKSPEQATADERDHPSEREAERTDCYLLFGEFRMCGSKHLRPGEDTNNVLRCFHKKNSRPPLPASPGCNDADL